MNNHQNSENIINYILGHIGILIIFLLIYLLLFKPAIRCDGIHYYAYLPSFIFDKDLNFYNEYAFWPSESPQATFLSYWTETGYISNNAAVGCALLWLPFFIIAHIYIILLNIFGCNIPENGFSSPYVVAVSIGTTIYAYLSCLISYKLIHKIFKDTLIAMLAVIFINFGSGFILYAFREPSYSHAISAFVTSCCIYIYVTNKNRLIDYIGIGLLCGLASIVRWQEAVLLILPIISLIIYDTTIITKKYMLKKDIILKIKNFLALIISFVVVFFIQMVTWKIIYGKFLLIPWGGDYIFKFFPKIWEFLFSAERGLFSFTPVLFFGAIGLYYLYWKEKNLSLSLLLILIIQIYINSQLTAYWGIDWSYGARRLISYNIIFCLGAAALLNKIRQSSRNKFIAANIIGSFLVLINLMKVCRFYVPTDTSEGFIPHLNISQIIDFLSTSYFLCISPQRFLLFLLLILLFYKINTLYIKVEVLRINPIFIFTFFVLFVALVNGSLIYSNFNTEVIYKVELDNYRRLGEVVPLALSKDAPFYKGSSRQIRLRPFEEITIPLTDTVPIKNIDIISSLKQGMRLPSRTKVAEINVLSSYPNYEYKFDMLYDIDTAAEDSTSIFLDKASKLHWVHVNYHNDLSKTKYRLYYLGHFKFDNIVLPRQIKIKYTYPEGELIIYGISFK